MRTRGFTGSGIGTASTSRRRERFVHRVLNQESPLPGSCFTPPTSPSRPVPALHGGLQRSRAFGPRVVTPSLARRSRDAGDTAPAKGAGKFSARLRSCRSLPPSLNLHKSPARNHRRTRRQRPPRRGRSTPAARHRARRCAARTVPLGPALGSRPLVWRRSGSSGQRARPFPSAAHSGHDRLARTTPETRRSRVAGDARLQALADCGASGKVRRAPPVTPCNTSPPPLARTAVAGRSLRAQELRSLDANAALNGPKSRG